MKKQQLRTIIGQNIRNERIARDISIDELALKLGLTPGFVGLMERGVRGTVPSTLYKLSYIFDLPIDSFFYVNGGPLYDDLKSLRKKIASFISDFSELELLFMLSVARGVFNMNHHNKIDMDENKEEE